MAQKDKISKIIDTLKKVEGVSNRNAEKITYSLLRMNQEERNEFGDLLKNLDAYIHVCPNCNVFFEEENCPYCSNTKRDHRSILLLNDYRLVNQFERTNSYLGVYHVVRDFLSMNTTEKMKYEDLNKLKERIKRENVQELIIGFDLNVMGEINTDIVVESLKGIDIKVSKLARGIPQGGVIEQYDLSTLEDSLKNRKIDESEN